MQLLNVVLNARSAIEDTTQRDNTEKIASSARQLTISQKEI